MQNQHKPVLIFAQSGRFLAQSATQAGYRVWVADCFGDQETLVIAERWQQLPIAPTLSATEILNLLLNISQGEDCILICGSGIESSYSFLDELPANIELIGNQSRTIHTLKTPQLFFDLLRQQSLPYPSTVFECPENNRSDWLIKLASGMGGSHIYPLDKATPNSKHYFQHTVSGLSGSALFLANGIQNQLLTINKQNASPTNRLPFRLGNIETPWLISLKHKNEIKSAINKITLATKLVGLNSLDFIISVQDELFLLEINPRPSASAELINNQSELFQHHLNACKGKLPAQDIIQSQAKVSLHYLYAPTVLTIPDPMIWPIECHDIPVAASIIQQGQPICTSLVRIDKDQQAKELHANIEQRILKQLLSSA